MPTLRAGVVLLFLVFRRPVKFCNGRNGVQRRLTFGWHCQFGKANGVSWAGSYRFLLSFSFTSDSSSPGVLQDTKGFCARLEGRAFDLLGYVVVFLAAAPRSCFLLFPIVCTIYIPALYPSVAGRWSRVKITSCLDRIPLFSTVLYKVRDSSWFLDECLLS